MAPLDPFVLLLFALLSVLSILAVTGRFGRADGKASSASVQAVADERGDVGLPRLEQARAHARVKVVGEVLRVMGDISIPEGTELKSSLVVHGNLRLGKGCLVHGSVKAAGDTDIGEHSVIEGHVLSEGRIRIRKNSTVKGIVDSLKEIIIEENANVDAVSTESTVRLGAGAKVSGRVLSSGSIVPAGPEQVRESPTSEKVEEEAKKMIETAESLIQRQPSEEEGEGEEPVLASNSGMELLEETLERLIASKMREELKRRIKTAKPESSEDRQ